MPEREKHAKTAERGIVMTNKEIKEMQKRILDIEEDLFNEMYNDKYLTDEEKQLFKNARFNLVKAWCELDNLIIPWEE